MNDTLTNKKATMNGKDEKSKLNTLTYPFMPADPQKKGFVIETTADWDFKPDRWPSQADVIVWGRAPDNSSSIGHAAKSTAARELTLKTLCQRIPSHLRVAGIYRLPPSQIASSGIRHHMRVALRSGVLVEFTSLPNGTRVLDAVGYATGAKQVGVNGIHLGSGGAMVVKIVLADGSTNILRLARADTLGDPLKLGETLEYLNKANVPFAPLMKSHGHTAGASWTVEQLLPGKRPAQITPSLALQVAEACARFPRSEHPPTSLTEDLHGVAKLLPECEISLNQLETNTTSITEKLPAVLRHGDLWAGNILIDHDRLTGLIDWDAANPTAVPGTDLLQMITTETRKKQHLALGPAFLTQPWHSNDFQAAAEPYWRSMGIKPNREVLDTIGLAWWITEVHGTLSRLPHRIKDEQWLTTNVASVLRSLGF